MEELSVELRLPLAAVPSRRSSTITGRTRTRRETLSRDEVVSAALRIIRRDGLDNLSMRGVAAELGAATMSTYNHVANKEELIELAAEAALKEEQPLVLGEDGWEASLRRFLLSQWKVFRRYPDLAGWHRSRPEFGTTPTIYEAWRRFFLSAGFTELDATRAWALTETYMMGRTMVDARLGGRNQSLGNHGLHARDFVEWCVDAMIAGIKAAVATEEP